MQQFPINLAKALLAVQGELRGVVKDSTNPHFKNRYASLEGVIDTVRPVMQAHGLVFMQAPGQFEQGVAHVTTSLIHAETGEAIHSTIGLPVTKQDPQGVGSAITYACRYSLMAMLGLPPVDDDAQYASSPAPAKTGNGKPIAGPDTLAKKDAKDIYLKLQREVDECVSSDHLRGWLTGNVDRVKLLPDDWQGTLRLRCQEKMADLRQQEAA
jgi:hypothetical protein